MAREVWQGTIKHEQESIEVILTLQDANGKISGFIDIIDAANNRLLRMGDILESEPQGAVGMILLTNTGLKISIDRSEGLSVGKIEYPEMDGGEGIGLEAEVYLTPVEQKNIFLPFIKK